MISTYINKKNNPKLNTFIKQKYSTLWRHKAKDEATW